MTTPKATSAFCQPSKSIKKTASGENKNWPKEPAAVPRPKAVERHSAGNIFPKAASTIGKVVPERPKPISTPAERSSIAALVECAIKTRPRA